jgi:hypothetical protein
MPNPDPQLRALAEEIRELKRRVSELYKLESPNQSLGTTASPTFANIYSGTYTPTLTGTANVAASTPYLCGYYRLGSTVTVFGRLDVDATAAAPTVTSIGISLPIASNFSAPEQCGGAGNCITTVDRGPIYADATNDRAEFLFIATNTANAAYYFSFSYRVI